MFPTVKPGSPLEKSIVSLISDGLKLELAAGDPAGGLTGGNEEIYFFQHVFVLMEASKFFLKPFNLLVMAVKFFISYIFS